MNKLKNLMHSKKNAKILYLILAICSILLMSYSFAQKSFQNDTFYTIKIGELISKNGIDMKDHFSNADLDYTYPHWLFDYLVYLVYANFGGFKALYILNILLTFILGLSCLFVLNKKTNNKIISLCLTYFMIYALSGFLALRAQIVTYTLFLFAYYFIDNIATKKEFNIKNSFFLIIISLLIANLHCAVWPFLFILFLPYVTQYFYHYLIGLFIFDKIKIWNLNKIYKNNLNKIAKLDKNPTKNSNKINVLNKKNDKIKDELEKLNTRNEKIKQRYDTEQKNSYKILQTNIYNIKQLLITIIICFAVGLLSPNFPTCYTYLIKTLQGTSTQNISEHLPIVLAQYTDELCALALIFITLAFTKVKISLHDLFMLSGLTIMMIMSRRQLCFFILIGGVIFGKLITQLLEDKSIFINQITDNKINTPSFTIICSILVFLISLIISYDRYGKLKNEDLISQADYPILASQFIKNNLDLDNIKLYNEYNYGSYLLFEDIKVFIDSRADLYLPEFNNENNYFEDFLNISSLNLWYDELFEKYGFTHFIIKNDNVLNLVFENLDKRFKQLYKDEYFSVYERIDNERSN